MIIERLNIDYITAQRGYCEQNGERHIKTLPWLSVVASIKGRYSIAIDGGIETQTEEGGCFIAPAGVVQEIVHLVPRSGCMEMQWVFLDVRINGIYRLDDLYSFPITIPAQQSMSLIKLMNQLLRLNAKSIQEKITQQRLGFMLLEQLMEYATLKEKLEDSIMPAIQKIRGSYGEQLSVEALSECCHLSVSTFQRKFKKATGMPPAAYIVQLRLSIASSMLITTWLPIGEIAQMTGFYDQFYFSRSFKRKYGITPSEYRKRLTGE